MECVIGMVILSIAALGIICSTMAGHQHLQFGEQSLRATRLAEDLLEEIISRPYSGHGAGRKSFHIDDFDHFSEAANQVADFRGILYGDEDQFFVRTVRVYAATMTLPELEGFSTAGKTVQVTVSNSRGIQCQLSRFIPAPVSP